MRRSRGFTIVELLIVIVVIGILAAITIVAYNGIQDRARFTKSQSDLSSLNKAILMYYADNGKYPISVGGTGCTNGWCGWDQVTDDAFIPGIAPQYIAKTPQLPTSYANGDTYLYYSAAGNDYRLMRYKSNTQLNDTERLNNPLIASPSFTNTGWCYKSDNINW